MLTIFQSTGTPRGRLAVARLWEIVAWISAIDRSKVRERRSSAAHKALLGFQLRMAIFNWLSIGRCDSKTALFHQFADGGTGRVTGSCTFACREKLSERFHINALLLSQLVAFVISGRIFSGGELERS